MNKITLGIVFLLVALIWNGSTGIKGHKISSIKENGIYIIRGQVRSRGDGIQVTDETGSISAFGCQGTEGEGEVHLRKDSSSLKCFKANAINPIGKEKRIWHHRKSLEGVVVNGRYLVRNFNSSHTHIRKVNQRWESFKK
jgi:hypothetical protein